MVDITRKQYYISSKKEYMPEMQEIELSCEAYLYIGKDLKIEFYKDAIGRNYIVLGNAYCTDIINKNISEDISDFAGNNINELVKSWTGKWLIITEEEIQIDATGLMPAFYMTGDNWCISSSLSLICKEKNLTSTNKVETIGLTWQLLPETIVDNVFGLICTQKINIKNKQLIISFNQWISNYQNLTTEDKVIRIANILKHALKNIELFSGKKIWIALTSGKDSRLILAAALTSKIEFTTYTLQYSNISVSDIKIPSKIAKDLGFKHNYIKAKKKDQTKINDYLQFNQKNSFGADINFYACNQFDKIPKDAIVIRGAIFEAAQNYGRSITTSDLDGFRKGIYSYYKESLKDIKQNRAFENWIKYTTDHNISFLDIRDRMYIEQRVGGWVSAIEQSLDINNWASIQIANCRELISILLSANSDERKNLLLSFNTINYLYPQLSKYQYNKRTIRDYIYLIINILSSNHRIKKIIRKYL